MSIKYAPQALRDLDRIWDDIVRVSASYDIADKYVNTIRKVVREKEDQPRSGQPLYYGDLFLGFWSVRYKKYRAFYRIRDDNIQVVRVLLITSNYIQILFRESQEEYE